jgi:hypothetical protein
MREARHVPGLDWLHSPVKDRNAPQKHVWRARIVLLSAKGLGTTGSMRGTGKSKTLKIRLPKLPGLKNLPH